MSIPGIHGVGRVAAFDEPALPATVAAVTAQARAAAPAAEIDEVTQQPVPLRFPWLSRLLQQLEAAAHQRPAFASAPVLGDRVDRSA